MTPGRHFSSLEDFLISTIFSVDGQVDDGSGFFFPVKGREIEATVLFADISKFSAHTWDLSAVETLIFVNRFFSWISARALQGGGGIVDKYIGDGIMVVFSTEFGSTDPFVEAVRTAKLMSENDFWAYYPHMGIASGMVIVGFVGTPIKYNCSVFGAPVARAARFAGVRSTMGMSSIVVGADEWKDGSFDAMFGPDGGTQDASCWQIQPARSVDLKNMGQMDIIEITKDLSNRPLQSAAETAKDDLRQLKRKQRYCPQQNRGRR